MHYSLSGYVPMLHCSTPVLNYFRSDAHEIRQGITDPEVLKSDFGCSAATLALCDASLREVFQDRIAQNTYGSADSLGGSSRLLSLVGGRFSGAHSEFPSAELRWNVTNENTPFDIWIMKDLRTGIQLALFYETGTVADQRDDLWRSSRFSTGLGARPGAGSGFICRFDAAYGDEGVATTMPEFNTDFKKQEISDIVTFLQYLALKRHPTGKQ